MVNSNIWLIGAGLMSHDYAKVLDGLKADYVVIGRGAKSAETFKEITGHNVVTGGLDAFLSSKPEQPAKVIVSVGIEVLAEVTHKLLAYGVKDIMVEKPAVGYASEIYELDEQVTKQGANVILAYNRRFYASVIAAEKIIEADGGVTSFNFEFTEWSHLIEKLDKHDAEHHNWFLGNSTHIVDTAFFLGGKPKEISAFHNGKGNLAWHPASSNFTGAGITEEGALFSYHANWQAPGRWVIDIMTNQHRLIFKPTEKLQIQNIGSVAVNMVEEVDYTLDDTYKPGLYLQTKAFLEGDNSRFCNVNDQKNSMDLYKKMSGY